MYKLLLYLLFIFILVIINIAIINRFFERGGEGLGAVWIDGD